VRARVGLVALALLAACSGGADEDGSGSTSDETTTTEEAATEVEVPASFRAAGNIDADGFDTDITAVVADPKSYDLVLDSGSSFFHVVRDGEVVYLLSAPDADAAAERLFQEGTADTSTALAALVDSASFGPVDDEFALTAAQAITDAVAELLFTDPAELLDPDVVTPDGVFDVELPDEITGPLDDLDLDEPEVEGRVEVDDDGVVRGVELRLIDDDVEVAIDAAFSDIDEVGGDDVDLPSTGELDLTPFVDEEEILVYDETPLLVPPTPPPGMELVGAVVIDAFESREGCRQLQVDFAPPEDPFGGEFLEYFLIDKTCVNQFDPTPFDETVGPFPSRFDGFEVLLGTTVVQIATDDTRFDVATFVGSLAPVTPEALIASVVPPSD
jgi:hypothetical protein